MPSVFFVDKNLLSSDVQQQLSTYDAAKKLLQKHIEADPRVGPNLVQMDTVETIETIVYRYDLDRLTRVRDERKAAFTESINRVRHEFKINDPKAFIRISGNELTEFEVLREMQKLAVGRKNCVFTVLCASANDYTNLASFFKTHKQVILDKMTLKLFQMSQDNQDSLNAIRGFQIRGTDTFNECALQCIQAKITGSEFENLEWFLSFYEEWLGSLLIEQASNILLYLERERLDWTLHEWLRSKILSAMTDALVYSERDLEMGRHFIATEIDEIPLVYIADYLAQWSQPEVRLKLTNHMAFEKQIEGAIEPSCFDQMLEEFKSAQKNAAWVETSQSESLSLTSEGLHEFNKFKKQQLHIHGLINNMQILQLGNYFPEGPEGQTLTQSIQLDLHGLKTQALPECTLKSVESHLFPSGFDYTTPLEEILGREEQDFNSLKKQAIENRQNYFKIRGQLEYVSQIPFDQKVSVQQLRNQMCSFSVGSPALCLFELTLCDDDRLLTVFKRCYQIKDEINLKELRVSCTRIVDSPDILSFLNDVKGLTSEWLLEVLLHANENQQSPSALEDLGNVLKKLFDIPSIIGDSNPLDVTLFQNALKVFFDMTMGDPTVELIEGKLQLVINGQADQGLETMKALYNSQVVLRQSQEVLETVTPVNLAAHGVGFFDPPSLEVSKAKVGPRHRIGYAA